MESIKIKTIYHVVWTPSTITTHHMLAIPSIHNHPGIKFKLISASMNYTPSLASVGGILIKSGISVNTNFTSSITILQTHDSSIDPTNEMIFIPFTTFPLNPNGNAQIVNSKYDFEYDLNGIMNNIELWISYGDKQVITLNPMVPSDANWEFNLIFEVS